jgi:hypothetical protein
MGKTLSAVKGLAEISRFLGPGGRSNLNTRSYHCTAGVNDHLTVWVAF